MGSCILEGEGAYWSDTLIWAKDVSSWDADYQRQYEQASA